MSFAVELELLIDFTHLNEMIDSEHISSAIIVAVVGLVFVGLYIWLVATGVLAMIRILNRTGYSGWWLLIGFVPVIGIIALSRFSKAKWSATASDPRFRKS